MPRPAQTPRIGAECWGALGILEEGPCRDGLVGVDAVCRERVCFGPRYVPELQGALAGSSALLQFEGSWRRRCPVRGAFRLTPPGSICAFDCGNVTCTDTFLMECS